MKKYTLSALVVLVAILALGGWLWYGKQMKKVPSSSQNGVNINSNTQDVTTNNSIDPGQKLYLNKKYNFEIKIPSSTEVYPSDKDNMDENVQFIFPSKSFSMSFVPYARLNGKELKSIMQTDLLDENSRKFVNEGSIAMSSKDELVNGKDIVITKLLKKKPPVNDPAFKTLYEFGSSEWMEGSVEEYAFFQCGADICTLIGHFGVDDSETELQFSKIISTLK